MRVRAGDTPGWPHNLTIRSRKFASSRLSYGRSNRSAPLTQDLDGAVEVVLRLGPGEGHTLAGALLERLGVGGHGLLKVRCGRGAAGNRTSDYTSTPKYACGDVYYDDG